MTNFNKKCMGEFPMFPGWLFFEEAMQDNTINICAYGPNEKKVEATTPVREFSVAQVLKEILAQYPPK